MGSYPMFRVNKNMETWQMWYMHRTENPANEVQLLKSPLIPLGGIGRHVGLRNLS